MTRSRPAAAAGRAAGRDSATKTAFIVCNCISSLIEEFLAQHAACMHEHSGVRDGAARREDVALARDVTAPPTDPRGEPHSD